MIFYRNLRYLPVALKSENLPMGWKEAIYTYPSSIVYEIHDSTGIIGCQWMLDKKKITVRILAKKYLYKSNVKIYKKLTLRTISTPMAFLKNNL
jgi:hypothetical protein